MCPGLWGVHCSELVLGSPPGKISQQERAPPQKKKKKKNSVMGRSPASNGALPMREKRGELRQDFQKSPDCAPQLSSSSCETASAILLVFRHVSGVERTRPELPPYSQMVEPDGSGGGGGRRRKVGGDWGSLILRSGTEISTGGEVVPRHNPTRHLVPNPAREPALDLFCRTVATSPIYAPEYGLYGEEWSDLVSVPFLLFFSLFFHFLV